MALTNKQARFVDEYLKCLNASEAARRAGYSERSARTIGPENLSKPAIAAEIELRLKQSAMSGDEVLHRLSQQARGEYAQYLEVWDIPLEDDQVEQRVGVDVHRMIADGNAHLIRRIKYDKDGRPEIEFYDAQSALVQLGRYHALFTDKLKVESDWREEARQQGITDDQLAELFGGAVTVATEHLAEVGT